MDRYALRSAAQKLGLRDGSVAVVIDAPRDYAGVIGALPTGAVIDESPGASGDVTLWFVEDAGACQAALPVMRRMAGRTKMWVLWRKGSELTQKFLRESAARVGLVDYKICAVDATWSAMLFARRKGD